MLMNTIETVFAAIIGIFDINSPYKSQAISPNSSIIIVKSERSLVCLVFIVLIDWGRYAKVVRKAAARPKINIRLSKSY
jgi:hypothetical protein